MKSSFREQLDVAGTLETWELANRLHAAGVRATTPEDVAALCCEASFRLRVAVRDRQAAERLNMTTATRYD